jgi:hypothetical protein
LGGVYSSPSGPPGIPPGPPLGALDVITSSMRSIIDADSTADFIACILTTIGSTTRFQGCSGIPKVQAWVLAYPLSSLE